MTPPSNRKGGQQQTGVLNENHFQPSDTQRYKIRPHKWTLADRGRAESDLTPNKAAVCRKQNSGQSERPKLQEIAAIFRRKLECELVVGSCIFKNFLK